MYNNCSKYYNHCYSSCHYEGDGYWELFEARTNFTTSQLDCGRSPQLCNLSCLALLSALSVLIKKLQMSHPESNCRILCERHFHI